MSDKNKKYNQLAKSLRQGNEQAIGRTALSAGPSRFKYVLLGVIIIVTFLCYHYSLGNEFTNWDDDRFITENAFIKSFSSANLKMILFHDVKVDNYVPVTMLSYALNYHFSGLAPQTYFLTNIIIHILNSCLMFFLILMMLKAMEECGYGSFKWKEWLAAFCTLVYAIHPMHVESVSWIAERKDVLYAFFYFAGLMVYIKYIAKSGKSFSFLSLSSYLLVLGLYLLSLLSKPMAVVFPFSLLAIDVLLKRDKTTSVKNIILEKVPFVCIAIVVGIITYHLQVTSGAVAEQQPYNIFQRFLFASNNFCTYIWKAFIPILLSGYYPFPILMGPSERLPVIFYFYPLIALCIIGISLYLSHRSGENNFRMVLFGFGFYFFNMVLVSQILNVGPTIMSDRYSYVCYFGIFFPLTYFIYKILEKLKPLIISYWLVAISSYLLLLAVICYQRTKVWHNSGTFWTDVIEKEPYKIDIAYHHLGHYYYHSGDMTKAYYNYWEAINLKINDARAYRVMGIIMTERKQYDSAFYCFKIALQEDSTFADAYIDRGLAYFQLGKYDLALKDYRSSQRLAPHSENLLADMGFLFLRVQQFDSAISYYNLAIQMNPANSMYFHCRGAAEFDKGYMKPALDDFIRNLNMAPHDSECMYFLSVAYNRLGNYNTAYQYAEMAKNTRYAIPNGYIEALKAKLGIQE